jgi:uncharacterized protein
LRSGAYLDSSALVKLVVEEAESAALRSRIGEWGHRVSSSIVEVEVLRVIRRLSTDLRILDRARSALGEIVLIDVDIVVRKMAASVDPPVVRTLDAIHLASALMVGADLAAFVTYDRRLFAAAFAAGLPAVAPGQPAV